MIGDFSSAYCISLVLLHHNLLKLLFLVYITCISLGRPFLSLAQLPTRIQTSSLIHFIGIISEISMKSTTIFNLEGLLASLSLQHFFTKQPPLQASYYWNRGPHLPLHRGVLWTCFPSTMDNSTIPVTRLRLVLLTQASLLVPTVVYHSSMKQTFSKGQSQLHLLI